VTSKRKSAEVAMLTTAMVGKINVVVIGLVCAAMICGCNRRNEPVSEAREIVQNHLAAQGDAFYDDRHGAERYLTVQERLERRHWRIEDILESQEQTTEP
jgi:hypothetical protein